MLVYWTILAWTAFVGLTWKKWFIVKTGIENGERYVRPTFASLFCSLIPLIFVIGMRTSGADTGTYIQAFNGMEPTFYNMFHLNVPKDKWFYMFAIFIKILFGNVNVWLTILATMQTAFICYTLCRYSVMPGVSIFLFIASTEFSYMFNGMRQFVAVTICFAAFRLLEKKKYFWYIVVVIIAAQFHGTAYVALIAVVAALIKPWSKLMYLSIAGFIVAMIFLNPILSGMQIFFEDTVYESNLSELITMEGVNMLRAVVSVIPCIIAWIFRNNKKLWNERKWQISINLSFMNAAFWIAASIVGGNLMARFAEYFTIYQLLTYPALFKYCFKGNQRVVVIVAFSLMYIVWFWYEMQMHWSVTYVSSVLGWYI